MRKYIFLFLLLFLSCKPEDKRLVAIRDFEPSLRPYLVDAAGTGVVGYDTATLYIQKNATDKELVLLSRSEQPILRAIALSAMMDRPSFDHFSVIMDHLDDTAMVALDAGEWGFWRRTVSDYLVERCGKWKTEADRARTIDAILLHHDYLRAAYTALPKVELSAAYYPHIRNMVQRDRDYAEIEYALYALARYKKKEDIQLIKDIIFRNNGWRMTETSFGLIKDFPDTAYMETLEEYFPRRFYHTICRQGGDVAGVYIETVGSYKNDSSAAILKAILDQKPFMPCRVDTSILRRTLVHAIWDNPCPAYTALRRNIEGLIRYYNYKDTAGVLSIDLPSDTFKDTVVRPEPVHWR